MSKKIGIIASDHELKSVITELFYEEVIKGDLIIEVLEPELIKEQGQTLEAKGVKAIIARSGSYRHTINRVSVPVINLKITTLDILHALKVAMNFQRDIVLVLSDLEHFDLQEWQTFFPVKITIERFRDSESIEASVEKYADVTPSVVIVGGGIPCSIAKKLNMETVHISASNESLIEKVDYANEIVNNLYDSAYKNEILKTVLNGVHDAVIAVDQALNIILFNESAQTMLGVESLSVINQNLSVVLPELDFMQEVLEDKVDQSNVIIKVKDMTITANASLLRVEDQIVGVLCSFQDVSKLQNLEKKIRFELNKKGLVAKYNLSDIIAHSKAMQDTLERAERIGQCDSTVMLYGESGTGKEMIAQGIHNISKRASEPFVAINCGAISETLLESELFGYEEGAFTGARKGGKPGLFELAHRGTLFLDEINSLPLNLQVKLLRVLEEKEIMRIGSDRIIPLDVRIIAAANESILDRVSEGAFRRDLFYRINILNINILPLRDRKEDIIPLFKYFLKSFSDTLEITPEIEQNLLRHVWLGNVRELKNIAQRYAVFGELDLDESVEFLNLSEESSLDLKEINRAVEETIIDILTRKGLSKNEIASKLGISRTALWKKEKNKEV